MKRNSIEFKIIIANKSANNVCNKLKNCVSKKVLKDIRERVWLSVFQHELEKN